MATACVIIVVVVFFEFYVFKTPMQQTTTVSIIMSDPYAWINKTVLVEDNITFAYSYLSAPPWNYKLSSNGATIGVSWQGINNFLLNGTGRRDTGVKVLVLGVITEGQVTPPINGTHTYNAYFIQAERIGKILSSSET